MNERIEKVFKDNEGIPLFYIESGSRLWGIASPDSDFDVRGFHLQSKKQYFDFKEPSDIIEIMDGDFDFVSYDIDKMFVLLSKSNPTVFEWIRAHIVYFNNMPSWTAFQKGIMENFDFKAFYHHYLSIGKKNLNSLTSDKRFTYKIVFYCIRGLLSADLATRMIIPELSVDKLFNQFEPDNKVVLIAKEYIARKREKAEKEEVKEKDKENILNDILTFSRELENRTMESTNDRKELERILTEYSTELKIRYY